MKYFNFKRYKFFPKINTYYIKTFISNKIKKYLQFKPYNFNKLPNKESAEEDMLDMAFEPKPLSRLSCQLTVSEELDGLVVNMPSKQG